MQDEFARLNYKLKKKEVLLEQTFIQKYKLKKEKKNG